MNAPPTWRLALVIVLLLALIAWRSPAPERVTDRGVYEATQAQGVVPDCTDLHCFRVLIPWLLGPLPGSSDVKWKTYSVVANTVAAVAAFHLSLAFAVPARVAMMVALLTALGFGSLYTLHDPFTSDPLMYALGPLLTLLLLGERVAMAGVIAAVGVLAKEFAAAPLYIVAFVSFFERRFSLAMRAFVAANNAFLVWLALQLTLMLQFNYGYGDNPSTHLLSGGYVWPWLEQQTALAATAALFNVFGASYLLACVGLVLAPPRLRHLALGALPVALLFAYVQQPDRALWNVHFIVLPLAAVALARAPEPLGWGVVAASAAANLRVGAQLTAVPDARFGHFVAVMLTLGIVGYVVTHPRMRAVDARSAPNTSSAL
jgi:hypothetical protein